MNAEVNHISVPLSRLQLSPRNVRKTGGATIEDLAASIAAHGLGQNLIVTRDGADSYAVEAGGRRLRALQHLVADGKLDADWPVPCKVVPIEQASEVSLAENQLREAMHPADQFNAIKTLVDDGLDEAEVAARFGVTRVFVRQRMKLAKVSPKIIADYRAGKTTLEVVEACALTDDIPRQERSYKQADNNTHHLRQLLTKGEVPATDKRVVFVGLEAYEAAGGPVHRDIFDPKGSGYVTDLKLLDKLVADRFAAEIEKLRAEGWGWIESGFDVDGWRFPLHHEKKGDKAKFGAIVSCDYRGQLEVQRWRMKPGQRASGGAAAKKAKPKDAAALSIDMTTRLEMHRAAAIREHVAADPKKALQLLALDMAPHLGFTFTGGGLYVESGLQAKDHHEGDGRLAEAKFEDLLTSPARIALQARFDKWQAIIGGDKKKSTPEIILGLANDQLLELLALCYAATIDLNRRESGTQLADALGIDMAKWWVPTAESFLGVVPKPVLAAAVAEVAGKAEGDKVLAGKKDAAMASAAEHLQGAGWLPKPLRGKAYALATANNPAKATPASAKKPTAGKSAAKKSGSKKTPKNPPKKAASKRDSKVAAKKPTAKKRKAR